MGTRGKKLTEVAVCWNVALELQTVLKSSGYVVVLTKPKERTKVTNRRRAEIANESHASLLIRLHCDAGPGSGLATYYPDRQGRIGTKRGPTQAVIAGSARMANIIHPAVIKALDGALPSRGILTDRATAVGSKHGALIGSIYSEVPSVLIEMCKLQNPRDEAFFQKKGGYRKMAEALAAGIKAAVPVHP